MNWKVWIVLSLVLVLPGTSLGRGFGRAGGGISVGRSGAAMGGYGGAFAGGARAGGYSTPFSSGAYGARGGSVTTSRGTTIQGGVAGAGRSGAFGGGAVGAGGVRVTTPGGQTISRGTVGGVREGAFGGVSAGRVSGGVASGSRGTIAGGSRAGAAVGPYGGVVAGGTRGGVAIGGSGRVAAVGHRSYYVSSHNLAVTGTTIRAGRYTTFNRGWYVNHPGAWRPGRWWGGSFWVVPTWGALVPWFGFPATVTMASYDYGSSVVFNDNRVYMNGTPTVTTDQYATQAQSFADAGRAATPDDDDEFRALGSFGMIEGEETTAQHIFQLAINKAGVVRGNYYNALTDTTAPLYGKLDKPSQRVAWTVGNKKDVVFEAGLNNLTREQTTAVVHYGKEKTIQMVLVRLNKPDDEK